MSSLLKLPLTQQQKQAGRYLPFPSFCLFSPPDPLTYAKMLFPTQKEETKKVEHGCSILPASVADPGSGAFLIHGFGAFSTSGS